MNTKLFSSIAAALVLTSTACHTNRDVAIDVDAPGVQDRIFVLESLAAGKNEIEMGKLGIQRAKDLDLRLLAQRIFDDHTKAQETLLNLANRKNIDIPTNAVVSPHLQQLSQISDKEFDQAYLRHLVQTHGNDITKYEATSRSGRSEEVRTFAATTLPVLREHLRIAQNIRQIHRANADIANEPAGAERKNSPRRDPYYQGDLQRPHQFDREEDR